MKTNRIENSRINIPRYSDMLKRNEVLSEILDDIYVDNFDSMTMRDPIVLIGDGREDIRKKIEESLMSSCKKTDEYTVLIIAHNTRPGDPDD